MDTNPRELSQLIEEHDRLLAAMSDSGYTTPMHPLSAQGRNQEPHIEETDEETVRVTPMREGGSRLPAGREEVTPRAELPQPIPYRPGSSGGSFQATSLDSDNLSLVLDDSCNKLKRDVLEFFLAARRQMMDHEASAVERERREWTRTLQAKQNELDVLADKCARKDDQVKRMTVTIMRAAAFRANTVIRAEALRLQAVSWVAWKDSVTIAKELKGKMRRWMEYYTKTYVIGSSFKAWRSSVRQEVHANLRKRMEEALEKERTRIYEEQAAAINTLRQECDELQFQLHKEREGRQVLEDQMKKAFMRGVCALNLEAMTLMKSGHPPAGINPFDGTSPEAENVAPTQAPEAPSYSGPVEALMERQAAPRQEAACHAPEPSASSASAALERFLAQMNRRPRDFHRENHQ